MNSNQFRGRVLKAGVAMPALALMGIAAPAFAQDATSTTTQPARDCADANTDGLCDGETVQSNAIIVTGSRIARTNLDSPTPVTVVSGETFFNQATVNVGDALNDLPQLRSTFSQSNSGNSLGTAGLNLLDLRGLGTQRTLTLVNGRRHVAADILNNGVSVDVNTIPTDLVERVDIVTGGNSAIYGSDAIAGVVNFVLKDDFEGFQVRGHANVNTDGDFNGQYISGLAGTNFAEGRGNVTVHAEFANQDRVFASNVPWLRQNNAFGVIDADPALGAGRNGSDGYPDRAFFRDIRSASIHYLGLVPIPQAAGAAGCGTGLGNSDGGPVNTGTPYNCTYIFNPDGTLSPQTGSRFSTGPIGGIVGGNGQTGREGQVLSVLPSQERINVNLLAKFEVSPALIPFVEAKYVNIKTRGLNSGPAFGQGGTYGDSRERPRLDNPYLNPAASTTIANAILASGLNATSLTARTPLTDVQRAAIADGSYRFAVARNLTDLGIRDEDSEREVYRIVAGLRGDFGSSFAYELSANYGKVTENTTVLGNLIPQRFMLAMDSARNSSGQIVCRSQIDPAAAYEYGNPGDAEALAADIANCVPYNPFGAGDNRAAAAYITQDTVSKATLEQLVVSGFVSGDTSSFFELPGGPIGFAVGGEYRREELFFQADPLVESGRTFYNALPTFDPEPFEVKEAFAELRLPLLADLPFVESFSVSGAVCVSDYNGATGTTWAYNGGAEWEIVRGLRLRGAYGRSVRAPNLQETSSSFGQNFAPGFSDPCLPQNIGNNPNRLANCSADLGGLLNSAQFIALPAYSLEILSGANPDLFEETSDSYTLGAVFTPVAIPGLNLTVDYFDISVDNVITSLSAQNVVNACYDQPDLNNQFCSLFQRFRGPGAGPNGEVPGQVLDLSARITPLNFASRTARGIDFDLSYSTDLGADATVSTRFLYTHNIERSNFENPSNPDFENRILSELGNPKDEFRWNVNLNKGPVTLGYTMSYIGPQTINLYEDTNALPGACTPNGCPPNNLDYADILEYPDVFYHDVRVEFEVEEDSRFTIGMDNILNTIPPLGLTGTGDGSGIYRVRGRNMFVSFLGRF
ncbi:TonB-dependent receptor domain-containing protein [Croceibacterium ferulae]|uniref:TonB-dependent receptor domain-containing protein n=1 Tax=Croceibacterium ferulae TaxID=1854641 RepID=UPI000EB4573F|nr:TonB-dependent receptor [Croceibacterium ferulae]